MVKGLNRIDSNLGMGCWEFMGWVLKFSDIQLRACIDRVLKYTLKRGVPRSKITTGAGSVKGRQLARRWPGWR